MPKVAFVLGGANTLSSDHERALKLLGREPDTMIMTNDTARDWKGDVPHFCTLHTEKMPKWIADRKAQGLPDALNYWTSNVKTIPPEHKGLYRNVKSWNGSSGLLGVTVALHLGYEKVILCGVPLDKKACHYFDDKDWMDAPRYRSAWTKHLHLMKGKVKSFTGWTNLILGEPTEEWLNAPSYTEA